jgi:sugar lactone lactonase YvrE
MPVLFKFSPDYKLIFAVDPALTNHGTPFRGHDMKVDAEDNAWTVDESGALVQKFSPDGKLLLTIGTKGKRGDWDESKGQRLLWEPVAIDFGPNGDVYIFSSHADESPNDTDSGDPTNNIGLARVLRLDKNGKFISQWFGSDNGPGKFYSGHGGAVDPVTGDVWVGDRQNYRIVIFNADGHFLRTISMRNLPSALFFDKRKGPNFGNIWLATGQDGQVLKLDRNGDVMGAVGSRKSTAPNHFSEAAFMGINSKGAFYVGDSQVPRVTELIPPGK